jgi:UDP-N-acetyl-D-mannosaminuronic acid transferase (WecB/TagA/CpsF family)
LTLFKNFPGGNMRYSGASAPTQDAVISYDRPSGAQTRHTPYRTPLLDVDVTHLWAEQMRQRITSELREGHQLTILAHRRNAAYLLPTDAEFSTPRPDLEMIVVEDMPVQAAVLLSRALRMHRLQSPSGHTGPTDWLALGALLPIVERVVCLGVFPRSAETAVGALAEQTTARVMGIAVNPWTGLEIPAVTEQILSFSPQVVLIGAGTQCTRIGARYWAAWEAERVTA